MKRIPAYVIVALCGLAFVSAGLLGMFADNTDPNAPPAEVIEPTVEQVMPTPTMTVEVVEVVSAPPVVSAPVESVPVQPPTDVPPVSSAPVVVEQPVVVVPADTVPPTAEVALPAGVVPIPTAIEVQPTVELPTAIPPTDVIPTVEVAAPTQVIPTDVPVQTAPTEVVPTVAPTAEANDQSSRDVPAAPPPTLSGPIKPAPTAEVPAVQPTDVTAPVQPTEVAPVIVPTVEVIAPTAEVPVAQPTTAPVDGNPAAASAQITGTVSFPDAQDFTGITILLTLPDGTQLQNVTGAAGTFEFLNLKPGTYKVVASAQGYLSRQIDVTLTDGQAMVLPSTFLVGGDTNFDNVIDLNDAVLIASNFDGPATVQTADPNRDGWIDVRDLALIGADYGLTGPIPWQ